MATILAKDNLVIVSTGNNALVWNSQTESIQTIEQPRTDKLDGGTSSMDNGKEQSSVKLPRKGETSSEHEERHMACISISPCGQWLALASSRGQKQLGLWRVKDWGMESARPMARAASCVCFTPSSSAVIVADKAGDVYCYSVKEPTKPKEWLLGHISMLLDVLVSPDEEFIITCDRDEKIRVSCFPNSYNIHSYCLGHDMFVTSLTFLPHNSSILVSTSGDGSLRLWDYKAARQLLCVDIQEKLNPDANRDESPLPVKSCVGMKLDPSTSLLCICIGGMSTCAVFRVCEDTSDGWQATLVQNLSLEAELWSTALTNNGCLLTLCHSQQDTVAAWQWQENSFTRSKDYNFTALNQMWDASLKSCFSNPSVPSMLYRRKYADEADKTIPSERPVKLLKSK